MRVILVDSETELIRCNFKFRKLEEGEAQIDRLAKTAASLLDTDEAEPEKYELGSFTPYKDDEGYFVFVNDESEEDSATSPTTLHEVLSSWSYVGYVHRLRRDRDFHPVTLPRRSADSHGYL